MIPLLLLAAAAAEPQCVRMEPVAGFEGWGKPDGATPAVSREVVLALKPAKDVPFMPSLARPAKDGTYGGFFPLSIMKAGHYRIALSKPAWIDLVRAGAKLKLAGHGHAPACSGMAKIVDYDLQPGRYWLQLSDAKDPSIGVMVAPAAK